IEVIPCLQRSGTKISEKATMPLIGSRLSNYVDYSAVATAKFRGVAVPIDLKLLNSFLADTQAHSTAVDVVLTPVDQEHVSASVSSAKTKPGLRALRNPVIDPVGNVVGSNHAGRE